MAPCVYAPSTIFASDVDTNRLGHLAGFGREALS